MVDISWNIKIRNTGPQNDVIAGCSLLDPNTDVELVPLPWWIIWNVPTGTAYGLTLTWHDANVPAGIYWAKARAWTSYSGTPTKLLDLKDGAGAIVGAVYSRETGLLHDWLDETGQPLIIESESISANIEEFIIKI